MRIVNTLNNATNVIPIVTTIDVDRVESSNISIQRYKNPKLIGQLITNPVKTVTNVSLAAFLCFWFTINNFHNIFKHESKIF